MWRMGYQIWGIWRWDGVWLVDYLVWFGFCRGMLIYYSICDIRTPAALCAYPVDALSLMQPITPTMT